MHTLHLPPVNEIIETFVLYAFVAPLVIVCLIALALIVTG